ncbi:DUF624 domain-containing protein [Streptococcus sp. NLN64]|uniref:DUF624 domain-containing protein n=1 Tax=Streptococcus sp. NLN64 TaxID=2822799 RepID=UPI0018CAC653|nr:DUF624 domain-containing protein [Streptococcus sp. NLN64]MBG9367620.1 DUF624 domain-containing protein [Streptococcus sp. NLN64]
MLKWMDSFFNLAFFLMKVSALYFVLVLSGGFLLGFSPANATLLQLYDAYGWDGKQYHFGQAFQIFKNHFRFHNACLAILLAVSVFLFSGIWLLLQFPPSLLQQVVLITNFLGLCFVLALYALFLKLATHFRFPLFLGLKLATIALFLDWKGPLLFLAGSLICLVLTFKLPLLLFFFLPCLWLFFVYDVFHPLFQKVERGYL